MQAIVARALGAPEVLQLEHVPVPSPGPGQVLVRLRAIGVNFAESERRRGVYAAPSLPWIPGGEGAGVVEALGPGADVSWRNRRVAFWAMPPAVTGTYAELAAVPQDALFALPDALSFEQGAALPLQGLTAWAVVHLAARARTGDTALVHAAGGGVGLIAVQLLRAAGLRVLGTVSSVAKGEAVAAAGGEPLPYGDDLVTRVRAATGGRGVDLVLDSVGKTTAEASLEMLAPLGTLVFFGEASGPAPPIVVDRLYERSLRVAAYGLDVAHAPQEFARARHELLEAVAEGRLTLRIADTLPLAEAAQAHRRLESRQVAGKLLLRPMAS